VYIYSFLKTNNTQFTATSLLSISNRLFTLPPFQHHRQDPDSGYLVRIAGNHKLQCQEARNGNGELGLATGQVYQICTGPYPFASCPPAVRSPCKSNSVDKARHQHVELAFVTTRHSSLLTTSVAQVLRCRHHVITSYSLPEYRVRCLGGARA